ncbi:hypothetical protein [Microlunatus speluncae]|nr:hypothetical protein [Microlunatus speluncae]
MSVIDDGAHAVVGAAVPRGDRIRVALQEAVPNGNPTSGGPSDAGGAA